ncbi:hypothetical protein CRG98_048117 [Punica granatum]|uniref:Uncharacterized protein n=1 Tax=Punica granatum TaxID=22663 RepID=A0A2I0HIQ4_PUNGR|nr:hypothetical protein CRG98_048117 [Punica granatum]
MCWEDTVLKVLACRRPASLLKQLRDLLIVIALLGAGFATGLIALCFCWKLVSSLKRLLAGDAPVSPLGRLLTVLPEVGLAPGAFWVPWMTCKEFCFDKYEWIPLSKASMRGLQGLLSAMHGYIKTSLVMP